MGFFGGGTYFFYECLNHGFYDSFMTFVVKLLLYHNVSNSFYL